MPKKKRKTIIVYCTKCKGAHTYDIPNTFPKSPKVWCKDCRYQFHITSQLKKLGYLGKKTTISQKKKSNFVPPQTKITPQPERVNSNPSPKYDETLMAMADIEREKHLYKMAQCDKTLPMRDRILAADKFVHLKDLSGTINIEEASEKELINEFRKQSTNNLVNILKESSLKEP